MNRRMAPLDRERQREVDRAFEFYDPGDNLPPGSAGDPYFTDNETKGEPPVKVETWDEAQRLRKLAEMLKRKGR